MLTLDKKDPGFRNEVHEEASPHLLLRAQDQRLGAEQDKLLCGSIETSAGNYQEIVTTCVVLACHTYDSLFKTILQGTLEGGRRFGRPRTRWMDNVKEWTSLPMPVRLTMVFCRKDRNRISAKSSLMCPRRPSRPGDSLN